MTAHSTLASHDQLRSLLRAADILRFREGSSPLLLSTGSAFRLCAYHASIKTYVDEASIPAIETAALDEFSSTLERLGFEPACTIIPGTRHLRLPTLASFEAALRH